VERSGDWVSQDLDGLHHGDRMCVGGTSGVNNAGQRDRVQGKDEHRTENDVNELLRVVQRKVTVKGTNGKADYWTYIQEAIWSMSSDDEDQQSYLKSSSLVSP